MTDVATAVRAMKAGAFDFLEKPYRYDQLRDSIQQAGHERDWLRERETLKHEICTWCRF